MLVAAGSWILPFAMVGNRNGCGFSGCTDIYDGDAVFCVVAVVKIADVEGWVG